MAHVLVEATHPGGFLGFGQKILLNSRTYSGVTRLRASLMRTAQYATKLFNPRRLHPILIEAVRRATSNREREETLDFTRRFGVAAVRADVGNTRATLLFF